ncbi:MAG: 3-oxoacyl-[acyl-carrier-protein] reductase [Flammeovirgaceae bacterium]|jgi:3-oxoacyl-[acyl-carrier protein] reductase|nr:3-oxoacyl-[acyl-carrier-protein] reductase [Flammeovirgaceae bacterium]|tara:strand:- start:1157 stop:1903 length:747 start_codon:yes stop_codon:yes gene_type:complete
MKNLENKTAIITGGSKGIGKGIVEKFAQEGCNIAFTYLSSESSAIEVEKNAKSYGVKVIKYKSDASNFDQSSELIENVIKDFGSYDILINNAGITRDNLLLRMDEDSWKKVIDINLNSCFNLTKCAIREFMKKKDGVIINISSIVGVKGNAGQSNYSASKAGINGFTKSVALELGSRNIRCNAIAPGFIETDMTSQGDGKLLESWIESIPLKRAGNVSDVANLCSYLASDKASYITGQIIKVDGGLVT